MRKLGRFAARLAPPTAVGGLLLFAAALFAHDPPKIDFDRRVRVNLEPGGVRVRYHLEISTFTLSRLPQLDRQIDISALDKTKPERSLAEAYLKRLLALIPDGLIASLNDEPLKWDVAAGKIEYRDSVDFVLDLRSKWQPRAGGNRFEIMDGNFVDQPGPFRLKLEAEGLEGAELNEPRERSAAARLTDEDRTGRAVFEHAAALPVRMAEPVAEVKVEPSSAARPGSKVGELFDTSYGIVGVFLLAFVFGAAHALTPGHGKTLVAAYLIGERGTTRHAFILGLVTTITHTGSVILIALVLWVLYPDTVPEKVQKTLGFIGGLLIALLGAWLLLRRLGGKADHVHLAGHSHSHSHGGGEHSHSHGDLGKGGTFRLILLGITGGIIPCWDAVILLGIAISTHQLWLGVPLLLVFSAGLASVLIAIGVAVVYAQRFGAGRWSESRWFKALPVASALLVTGIGLWLCADSLGY